eukprot:GHVT01083138.1.p1 GENE.GHVT01083138.1~~GHVT01083138.1.p1  ORF type:complete len:116 (+),score=10.26 GHVT01083138.1:76-423(+)
MRGCNCAMAITTISISCPNWTTALISLAPTARTTRTAPIAASAILLKILQLRDQLQFVAFGRLLLLHPLQRPLPPRRPVAPRLCTSAAGASMFDCSSGASAWRRLGEHFRVFYRG